MTQLANESMPKFILLPWVFVNPGIDNVFISLVFPQANIDKEGKNHIKTQPIA
jgi:hypothetical protein